MAHPKPAPGRVAGVNLFASVAVINRRIQAWPQLAILVLLAGFASIASAQIPQDALSAIELPQTGQLYLAAEESFPTAYTDIGAWLQQRQPTGDISLLGGSYWLYAEIRHSNGNSDWVLNPSNTLIDQIEARLYTPDGQVQTVTSGYASEHDYMLHYGKDLRLQPNQSYRLLIHFSSPYFASYPRFQLEAKRDYQHRVAIENLLIIGALGALVSLAVYNFFIYILTRDNSRLYYAAYLIAFCLGWAFAFHIPAELFGWHDLHLHYLPFFLLPVFNTLFYLEFLDLPKKFPRLAAISHINLVLPLILLPSCFFALSYAHLLATLAIALWLVIALISGIASCYAGYRPARYFVLAFVSLWVSGALILPANIGLIPDVVDNAELLTLMCGTLDGLLLAFALAYQIRLLSEEKDNYLRRKELAEAASHAKSEFLASISHELRTPLNGILGFTQIMQASVGSIIPAHQEYLAAIRRSGDYLLTLINDLLDLSRIEAGRLELAPKDFHFEDFLVNLLDTFHFRALEKNIEFRCETSGEIPEFVSSDEKRLRQILINLLSNAIKFTRKGIISLKVEYHHGIATFQVKDTGDGIDPKDLERIFLPFERLEYHRSTEGTGLGLAISKRLVESMQGRLEVDSVIGQGSTFRVILPLPAGSEPEETAHPGQTAAIAGYSGGPYKILIVDDIEDNIQILSAMLAPLGFILDSATDGETCLHKQASFQPALILMDILMPTMDGLQAIALLRQNPLGKYVKVIAVTANAFEENRRTYLQAGFDDVITKPVRRDELLQRLQANLNLHWHYAPEHQTKPAALMDIDRPLQVLIADDNEINRALFKAQFRDINAHVRKTGDGLQALREIFTTRFDLIFLDLRIPLIGGEEIMRQLSAKAHGNQKAVFIAITAFIPPEEHGRLFELGFHEVLVKPIGEAQIRGLIERHAEHLAQTEPPLLDDTASCVDMSVAFYTQRLLSRANGNKMLVLSIFSKLFKDMPLQIQKIGQCIDASDYPTAKFINHKLRGSVAFCDFIDLEYTAAQLDAALINERSQNIRQWFHHLDQEVAGFVSLQEAILHQIDVASG